MDEIIHKQHICNLQIDDAVTMFFMNNPSFIYLKDEYGLNYEMPIVAYSGQPDNKLNFTYVFGVTKKRKRQEHIIILQIIIIQLKKAGGRQRINQSFIIIH